MSDYTPTTEEVRARYSDDWHSNSTSKRDAEFDRWLAEHDREVCAKAWYEAHILYEGLARKVRAEAWEEGWRSRNSKRLSFSENPYRQGETE